MHKFAWLLKRVYNASARSGDWRFVEFNDNEWILHVVFVNATGEHQAADPRAFRAEISAIKAFNRDYAGKGTNVIHAYLKSPANGRGHRSIKNIVGGSKKGKRRKK